jgi:signal transduction histidine kinase
VVAGTADLAAAIRDINRLVALPLGARLASCSLLSSQLRAATGALAPLPDEVAAIEGWRAALGDGAAPAEPVDNGVEALVPVIHRSRVHGAVRVDWTNTGHDTADLLLPAIGLALGEVVWKAGVRRELARNRRRLAIAVEQERTARDVQTSVHRRLAIMGDRLAAHLAAAPDRVWRERMQELLVLTGEVDRDVRQSLNVLRSLPAQSSDLPTSLRGLARELAAETELFVKVFVDGEPRRLSSARVEALFHVAVESLVAAAFASRAGNAVVVLEYRPGQVALEIRDDGVGLAQRNVFGTAGSKGLRGAQQRLTRVGGRLRLHGLRPRGVVIEAVIPTRRSGAESGGHRDGRDD